MESKITSSHNIRDARARAHSYEISRIFGPQIVFPKSHGARAEGVVWISWRKNTPFLVSARFYMVPCMGPTICTVYFRMGSREHFRPAAQTLSSAPASLATFGRLSQSSSSAYVTWAQTEVRGGRLALKTCILYHTHTLDTVLCHPTSRQRATPHPPCFVQKGLRGCEGGRAIRREGAGLQGKARRAHVAVAKQVLVAPPRECDVERTRHGVKPARISPA